MTTRWNHTRSHSYSNLVQLHRQHGNIGANDDYVNNVNDDSVNDDFVNDDSDSVNSSSSIGVPIVYIGNGFTGDDDDDDDDQRLGDDRPIMRSISHSQSRFLTANHQHHRSRPPIAIALNLSAAKLKLQLKSPPAAVSVITDNDVDIGGATGGGFTTEIDEEFVLQKNLQPLMIRCADIAGFEKTSFFYIPMMVANNKRNDDAADADITARARRIELLCHDILNREFKTPIDFEWVPVKFKTRCSTYWYGRHMQFKAQVYRNLDDKSRLILEISSDGRGTDRRSDFHHVLQQFHKCLVAATTLDIYSMASPSPPPPPPSTMMMMSSPPPQNPPVPETLCIVMITMAIDGIEAMKLCGFESLIGYNRCYSRKAASGELKTSGLSPIPLVDRECELGRDGAVPCSPAIIHAIFPKHQKRMFAGIEKVIRGNCCCDYNNNCSSSMELKRCAYTLIADLASAKVSSANRALTNLLDITASPSLHSQLRRQKKSLIHTQIRRESIRAFSNLLI